MMVRSIFKPILISYTLKDLPYTLYVNFISLLDNSIARWLEITVLCYSIFKMESSRPFTSSKNCFSTITVTKVHMLLSLNKL